MLQGSDNAMSVGELKAPGSRQEEQDQGETEPYSDLQVSATARSW